MRVAGTGPYDLPVTSSASSSSAEPRIAYAPPELIEIGGVYDRTLQGGFCAFGKQFGGSDGFTFMGISVPISNCSQ